MIFHLDDALPRRSTFAALPDLDPVHVLRISADRTLDQLPFGPDSLADDILATMREFCRLVWGLPLYGLIFDPRPPARTLNLSRLEAARLAAELLADFLDDCPDFEPDPTSTLYLEGYEGESIDFVGFALNRANGGGEA